MDLDFSGMELRALLTGIANEPAMPGVLRGTTFTGLQLRDVQVDPEEIDEERREPNCRFRCCVGPQGLVNYFNRQPADQF